MENQFTEQRKYHRHFFSAEDTIVAQVEIISPPLATTGKILNLSAGGLHISFDRVEGLSIEQETTIKLLSIDGLLELKDLESATLEVKWVFDSDILTHLGCGCEFKNISADLRNKLVNLVDTLAAASTSSA